MSDLIHQLRQGAYHCDDYRWRAADEITLLRDENKKLRFTLLRIRRWGSPMVKGYIDGALGGSDRGSGPMVDDENGEMVTQEEKS